MNPVKNIEKLEHSSVKMTITVTKEDVRAKYDEVLREFTKTAQVDGFRKGKVPANLLERKYGEYIKSDALKRIIDESAEAALKDEELAPLPYSQPELLDELEDFNIDADLSYSIQYDVFPEVTVGDISGVEVEVPQVSIAKADEERELDEIRERNAIVRDREDGSKAEKGNIATVNYCELDEEGEVVSGTEREDFVFEIGTGYNIYKFDDDLIGMKKDDEKILDKSWPEDFEYPELAGQSRKIRVKLTVLKEKELPALDDELAQDVSEKFATLSDLKADIKTRLEKQLEDKLASLKEKGIIEALVEKSSIDLPEAMIRAELGARIQNLAQRMGIEDAQKFDAILQMSGKSMDSLMDEWRPESIKAIKTRLVLDNLIKEAGWEPQQEDIDREFEKMAASSSTDLETLRNEYEKQGMMEYITDRIKEDRVLLGLEEKIKIKKGKKQAFVDLFK